MFWQPSTIQDSHAQSAIEILDRVFGDEKKLKQDALEIII